MTDREDDRPKYCFQDNSGLVVGKTGMVVVKTRLFKSLVPLRSTPCPLYREGRRRLHAELHDGSLRGSEHLAEHPIRGVFQGFAPCDLQRPCNAVEQFCYPPDFTALLRAREQDVGLR